MREPDFIAILEAIYKVEQPLQDWLLGITQNIGAWLDEDGLGTYAFVYDVVDDARIRPSTMVEVGCADEVRKILMEVPFDHQPDFIRKTYLTLDCCAVSQIPEWEGCGPAQHARMLGIYDNWGINGRNWDNHGLAVLVNRARPQAFSSQEYVACTRLSTHLASAYRLRTKLEQADSIACAEAVIDAHGTIQHAVGEAQTRDAQELLLSAVREREYAQKMQRSAAGLVTCKGRVDARWTLLDHFDHDGKRFILAQENEQRCGVSLLSARERQVMVEASLGRSNKEIAYALGLAHSTVRVLLGRAAMKLGARARADAIARFDRLADSEPH